MLLCRSSRRKRGVGFLASRLLLDSRLRGMSGKIYDVSYSVGTATPARHPRACRAHWYGADRLVARIIVDLDEGDFDVLSLRRPVLRRGAYECAAEEKERKGPSKRANHRCDAIRNAADRHGDFSPCLAFIAWLSS
jgi:hypothetical protein